METSTLEFEVEGFGPYIESVRVGSRVEVRFGGVAFHAFDGTDVVARDCAIAMMLDTGLQGKTVAMLCRTSPAQVSMVRTRYRGGGFAALLDRGGRPGRPPRLEGRRLERARKLRRGGLTYEAISKKVGVPCSTVARVLRDIPRGGREDEVPLPGVGALPAVEVSNGRGRAVAVHEEEAAQQAEPSSPEEPKELMPGVKLPVGPAEHPSRYAGTLLVCAAMQQLGVDKAIDRAGVRRPKSSVYDAHQALMALSAAWAAGYGSLEAMHERDARALGVVLGLERCPSVRTMHRAIGQMVSVFDPIKFGSGLMQGVIAAGKVRTPVLGVDGHVKPYHGREPIDKGWDTKRRMAVKAVADVMVHDERGWTWLSEQVEAGDSLHAHLVGVARRLRNELGDGQPVVLAFDRGGFAFDVLNSLDGEGFGYVTYVPATVKTPDLEQVAPRTDGVGEMSWSHERLDHEARLLVRRDGESFVPMTTNLPKSVEAVEVVDMLRSRRGMQENAIKAARSFAHLDRLVDRGGAKHAEDDRLVPNPERQSQERNRKLVRERLDELERQHPSTKDEEARRAGDIMMAELEEALLEHQMAAAPKNLPRFAVEPEAQRAWLKTLNRSLLGPLKLAVDNARRCLLDQLGPALSPTDANHDDSTRSRTLTALVQAPGTVRFDHDAVHVSLDMPLPPTAHERLDEALQALDTHAPRFSDREHLVHFQLAPRPMRHALPSAGTSS